MEILRDGERKTTAVKGSLWYEKTKAACGFGCGDFTYVL